jgi:hypothetical protein
MNESIARSRTRGSPRWREKTMMIAHSGKPDIPLHESLYHLWVGVLHQDECKDCSPEKLNKERMKRNLKTSRHTRKRSLYTDGRKLDGEPPMHSRSVVKNLYNRDIVSE